MQLSQLPEFRSFLEQVMGIQEPWHITDLNIDPEQRQVDISIDFRSGAKFPCPECGMAGCGVHDTREKSWRHLNLFQFKVFIHARVPRVGCSEHGVHQVPLPWAREGSGFTLFFEALVMEFAQAMPVKKIADMLEEHDTRLWRIIHHYVQEAVDAQDLSDLQSVGVDETARRKGRKYITTFMNLRTSRPVWITEGKGSETLNKFSEFFLSHGGHPSQIKDFSCDMSPAFISGIETYFPAASITFDKFHVIKMMSEALDAVRRSEQKDFETLKGTKWFWLKGSEKLSASQRTLLNDLIGSKSAPKTTRAYGIYQSLKRVYSSKETNWAESALKSWYNWASHSRMKAVTDFARSVKKHWDGIVNYFRSRWTNNTLEALNGVFKSFAARARGYRSTQNAIDAYFLSCGKLKFALPRAF